MIRSVRTIYFFEKSDLKAFNQWKKDNNLSLRKIGREIGISGQYINDMIKGKNCLCQQFLKFLYEHELIVVREDKTYIRGANLCQN